MDRDEALDLAAAIFWEDPDRYVVTNLVREVDTYRLQIVDRDTGKVYHARNVQDWTNRAYYQAEGKTENAA